MLANIGSEQEPDDKEDRSEQWERSLGNLAGDAISLVAFWNKEFGKEWKEFETTAVTLAKQAAKSAARFAKAKGAFDEVIKAVYMAQADALEIEAQAKRRIANEYDAAQAKGEVATKGKPLNIPGENIKGTVKDLGISSKDIHDARKVRDAEDENPGVIREVLDRLLSEGKEPTKPPTCGRSRRWAKAGRACYGGRRTFWSGTFACKSNRRRYWPNPKASSRSPCRSERGAFTRNTYRLDQPSFLQASRLGTLALRQVGLDTDGAKSPSEH